MAHAIIAVGSNIDPQPNIAAALQHLTRHVELIACSQVWEFESMGSPGPNYLNLAVEVEGELGQDALRALLKEIEQALGRVRDPHDKNAPRVIDLDLVVYAEQVADEDFWERPYQLIPLADLRPDLVKPGGTQDLAALAGDWKERIFSLRHPELRSRLLPLSD